MILSLISFAFFISFVMPPVLAQTPTPAEKTGKVVKPVEYYLAFPGILPDHPLYKLKVLRNKIREKFIYNPQAKIAFYLKEADKGILSAAMLVDKGKFELAGQTALRAEHNYTLLAGELWKLNERPGEEFFANLLTAAKKHQEVLRYLQPRVPEPDKTTLKTVAEFSLRNMLEVEKYRLAPLNTSL